MKKYLLLVSTAIISISSFAQENNEIGLGLKWLQQTHVDAESTNILIKKNNIPNNKAVSSIELGTSFNAYGILGDRQNQVVYNSAINTVAFVHRQNAGGTVGGANATGVISLDYSTDGGTTWSINPFPTTPTGSGSEWKGNRYPNMAIYNPTANTDPTNAFLVQAGPTLETGISSNVQGWAKTFRASAKFDGTLLNETYDNNSTSSQGNLNEWAAGGLYVTSQGTAWYVSTTTNNSAETPDPTHDVADNYSEYFIVRGDFNNTSNSFDWTVVESIAPAWNTTDNSGTQWNMAGLPNMAWSVDGNTGYMVVMGSWGLNTMHRPYVMKTTDAGANWNHVNDYDFSQNTTFQNIVPAFNAANPLEVRPWFSSFDIVVSSDDELRIFVDVQAQSSDHPDSLLFTFTSASSHGLYEVATNGSAWDVTFIDSIYVEDHEWDATNTMSHFVRPQASRSQDGSKVFYSWLGSNTLLSAEREFPEVWSVAHDISGTEPMPWSTYKNLSDGTPASFVSAYQTVAVDVIENGNDQDWELPLVYGTALGGASITNAIATPQWNFLKGVGFSAIDFTAAGGGSAGGLGSENFHVGIEKKVLTSNNVRVFPNPTSNGIVTLQISESKEFNYSVIDMIGNVVQSNHVNGSTTIIDLTNNARGVYFINIDNGTNVITKKVMVTK